MGLDEQSLYYSRDDYSNSAKLSVLSIVLAAILFKQATKRNLRPEWGNLILIASVLAYGISLFAFWIPCGAMRIYRWSTGVASDQNDGNRITIFDFTKDMVLKFFKSFMSSRESPNMKTYRSSDETNCAMKSDNCVGIEQIS